jgi:Raf kinase inhibitor-like YbhB/YbcL family protein
MLDDPDAVGGTFTHWITYNMPWASGQLAQGQNGPAVRVNDAGRNGYFGPCPPAADGPHHYVFHLYALSDNVAFDSAPARRAFLSKIAGITLGEVDLTATYDR